jgi:hypothetical protein
VLVLTAAKLLVAIAALGTVEQQADSQEEILSLLVVLGEN